MKGRGITASVAEAHSAAAHMLVERFKQSGVEYTSRAAVLSVIDEAATLIVVRMERNNPKLQGRLRARRAINLACDRIHAERGSNA